MGRPDDKVAFVGKGTDGTSMAKTKLLAAKGMDSLLLCLHCIAQPQQYKKKQWFALVLDVASLSIGLWAGYRASPSSLSQVWLFYSVEAGLAFSVAALLWFAFSTYPRNPNDV